MLVSTLGAWVRWPPPERWPSAVDHTITDGLEPPGRLLMLQPHFQSLNHHHKFESSVQVHIRQDDISLPALRQRESSYHSLNQMVKQVAAFACSIVCESPADNNRQGLSILIGVEVYVQAIALVGVRFINAVICEMLWRRPRWTPIATRRWKNKQGFDGRKPGPLSSAIDVKRPLDGVSYGASTEVDDVARALSHDIFRQKKKKEVSFGRC